MIEFKALVAFQYLLQCTSWWRDSISTLWSDRDEQIEAIARVLHLNSQVSLHVEGKIAIIPNKWLGFLLSAWEFLIGCHMLSINNHMQSHWMIFCLKGMFPGANFIWQGKYLAALLVICSLICRRCSQKVTIRVKYYDNYNAFTTLWLSSTSSM